MKPLSSRAFAQSFALKPGGFAWLLGAGASASAGIPTGYLMIEDFRRQIYERLVGGQSGMSSTTPQELIDARLADVGVPPRGDPTEYSVLFEKLFPDAAERRQYIDRQVKLGNPSAGHRLLGALLATGTTPCVFTTNFDQLIERSATLESEHVAQRDRAHPTVAAIDNPERAQRCVKESDWPLIAKLHGDFQSTSLKNTGAELLSQDERMRHVLGEVCSRFGLIVVGYSGRDESVMQALESCLAPLGRPAFPMGLYWVTPKPDELLPAVTLLLERARAAGVKADVVQCADFDSFARDIASCIELPEALLGRLLSGGAPSSVSISPRQGDVPSTEGERRWWRRHVRVLASVAGSLALTAAGIGFAAYQAAAARQAKWDGLYDVIAKQPESDRERIVRSIEAAEQDMVATSARDDSTNFEKDLKLAQDWKEVASLAIAVWRPLSDCVRVRECEPGKSGPEACRRASTLAIAIARNNGRLQSMGQLANLGFGGERPALPPVDVLEVLLANGCAGDLASRDAVRSVTEGIRAKRVDAARVAWKEVEASGDLQGLRAFGARYIDVTHIVPGQVAYDELERRFEQAIYEGRKEELRSTLCALSTGSHGGLERMRSVARPKPSGCDQLPDGESCTWNGFYSGLKSDRHSAPERTVIGILEEMVRSCFAPNSLEVEAPVESHQFDTSHCTRLTQRFRHRSGVRVTADTCGQWTRFEVRREAAPPASEQASADLQTRQETR